ncbi:DUF6194 family protein [Lentisphaera profundi]|uniref:DUF6194 family protein n=1 Tax=Lentisphaera profundi TaxID=1658616 RepID=A0ABY7VNR4_9BACT|nr:DUF6194 family protein [Lentisphaera profundi]WDE95775.1 DUF6194 family protein [Lentisphaera profundi]
MTPALIIEQVLSEFEGVIPKSTWGETSLFYNPGKVLPNGVYFCTIKEKNGDNDKASALDRAGIFRLSMGVSKASYKLRFGDQPKRANKGGIVDTRDDFEKLNSLMPHPIYGWMSWVQVLNPSQETFTELSPLLQEAYSSAKEKFSKKLKSAGKL